MLVLRLVRRSMRAHAMRFALTVCAVTLGVAFVAGTAVLTDSLHRTFEGMLGQAGKTVDAYVRGPEVARSGSGPAVRGPVSLAVAEKVAQLPGVEAVWPDVAGNITVLAADGTAVNPAGVVALPAHTQDRGINVISGRLPSAPTELAVDAVTAEAVGAEVGGPVTVVVEGEEKELVITAVVAAEQLGGRNIVWLPPAVLHDLLGVEQEAQGFVVVAKPGVGQEQVVADIVASGVVGDGEVITGEQRVAEEAAAISKDLGFVRSFLYVFAAISLIVGAFLIVNTFAMVVASRTAELATLRAVGGSAGQVLGLVLVEAAVIGVVGASVGLVAGTGLGTGIAHMLRSSGMPVSGLVVSWRAVTLAYAVGVVVTVASAVVPAVKASSVPPLAALSQVAGAPVARSGHKAAVGGATVFLGVCLLPMAWWLPSPGRFAVLGVAAMAVAVGLTMVGMLFVTPVLGAVTWPVKKLGVVAALARGNLLRNPVRTATTAGALTMAVTLVAAVSVLSSSASASMRSVLDAGVRSDLVVQATEGGLTQEVVEAIAGDVEVGSVTTLDAIPVTLAGVSSAGLAVTASELAAGMAVQMVSGDVAALDSGLVLISEGFADRHGLATGQVVPVDVGVSRNLDVAVGGVFERNPALGDAVVVPRGLAEQGVPQGGQLQAPLALVTVAAGVEVGQAQAVVARRVAQYGVFSVVTKEEFTDERAAPIRDALQLVLGLLGLSVVIAGLGIVNTLVMSVAERTAELGLLRAVGAGRQELWVMVTFESVMTAWCGAWLGVAVGVGLGAGAQVVLGDYGLAVLAVPWQELAWVVAGAVVMGTCAAVVPGLRAGRVSVLSAIAGR